MKLRNRFLLVGFGVVVFLILTPTLILFTRGYKIDWANKKFVKTGALVAKTLPSKAQIYLNNKPAEGETPETIRFLLPGDYDIRIEKEGYQSWTKRLHIQAQLASWVNLDRDFIALFKQNADKISTTDANFSSLSRTGEEVAFVHNDQLFLYNVAEQATQDLGDISRLIVPFTFANNLEWSNGARLWSYFNQNNANLTLDVKNIRKVYADGANLALLSGNELYILDGKNPKLIDKPVSGFAIDGENLWYVQEKNLKQYNLRTATVSLVSDKLPVSTTARIIRGEGNTFLLLDDSLFVLNDSPEKIYDGVSFAEYDSTADKLLFANQNEILLYNPQQKNTELILRSISPVSNPVLNAYTGYVFFKNESKVKAIELDGRDHRNIYDIVPAVAAESKFAVAKDGSLLTIFNDTSITTYRIR